MHKAYDRKELSKVTEALLKIHTLDDLKTALNVIETGISLIEKSKLSENVNENQ